VSEWQPIETAPQDGTWVLVFRPRGMWNKIRIGYFDGQWRTPERMDPIRPTHWMPLPEPPHAS
jgi:hypothetical protein